MGRSHTKSLEKKIWGQRRFAPLPHNRAVVSDKISWQNNGMSPDDGRLAGSELVGGAKMWDARFAGVVLPPANGLNSRQIAGVVVVNRRNDPQFRSLAVAVAAYVRKGLQDNFDLADVQEL